MPARYMLSSPRTIFSHSFNRTLKPNPFEFWRHANSVMVAEDGIERPSQMRPQSSQPLKRRLERPKGGPAKISGKHTEVIVEFGKHLCEASHRAFAHIHVQVA